MPPRPSISPRPVSAPSADSGHSSAPGPVRSLAAPGAFISVDKLEIRQTAIRRPLVSLWAAAFLLDCDEDQIIARIESGQLEFCFDIAAKKSKRRCLRVLTSDVFALKSGVKPPARRSLASVLAAVIPQARKDLPVSQVAFSLHCGAWTICLLLKTGLLQGRRGPNHRDWRVSCPSLTAFLTARRVA